MWNPHCDSAKERKAVSFSGITLQSHHSLFLGVPAVQPGGRVLLGDGVAKNVSL